MITELGAGHTNDFQPTAGMMKNAERRRQSGLDAGILFGLIIRLRAEATQTGINASEVWLGPKEARILEAEMNWQESEGQLRYTNENARAMIHGDMEGAQLLGLRVRLMVKDGVRVGISLPK